jgi:hypothetical protein
VPIPTRSDADAGQQGLYEEDTTAKVEGTASWGRGRGAATQRRGTHDGCRESPRVGSEGTGDDVERELLRR